MSEKSIVPINPAVSLYRNTTEIADICREVVKKTAIIIGSRQYVPVEGWMTIAICHGCIATIKEGSVQEIDAGIRAVAEIRRQSDGAILTSAEGFVGKDEVTWYGGPSTRWDKINRKQVDFVAPKREDYAIRSMAQTRAVSRACRTAFAHVVVLIDKNLSTTPAEEVGGPQPDDGDDGQQHAPGEGAPPGASKTAERSSTVQPEKVASSEDLKAQFRGGAWKGVHIHFGQQGPEHNPPDGLALEQLTDKSIDWWINQWQPRPYGDKGISPENLRLRAALDVAGEERKK